MVLSIFTSVEFYIFSFAIAMVIVAFFMHPNDKGEAMTFFAHGFMLQADSEPSIELKYDDEQNLTVVRRGVFLNTVQCELNYAITVIGKDIKISEKLVVDRNAVLDQRTVDVAFSTDKIMPGKYHIYLDSQWSGQWAAGTFRLEAGRCKTLEVHT